MKPTRPILVYIAGPFRAASNWEIEQNVRRAEALALQVAVEGAKAGIPLMPVCPHTNTREFHGYREDLLPGTFWLEGTLEMMRRCDVVLLTEDWERSSGARAERQEAFRQGIPVYATLEDLIDSAERGPFGNKDWRTYGREQHARAEDAEKRTETAERALAAVMDELVKAGEEEPLKVGDKILIKDLDDLQTRQTVIAEIDAEGFSTDGEVGGKVARYWRDFDREGKSWWRLAHREEKIWLRRKTPKRGDLVEVNMKPGDWELSIVCDAADSRGPCAWESLEGHDFGTVRHGRFYMKNEGITWRHEGAEDKRVVS